MRWLCQPDPDSQNCQRKCPHPDLLDKESQTIVCAIVAFRPSWRNGIVWARGGAICVSLMSAAANDTVGFYCRAAGTSFPYWFRLDVVFEGTRFRAMRLQLGALVRGLSAGFVLQFGTALICAAWSDASAVQKLVDPNSVAPEYRAAAEKRRTEQIKQLECTKKAEPAKVLTRDRVAYINECLDK